MTDIPIIFSAPMVEALLAGRKTMTRRFLYAERRSKNGLIPRGSTLIMAHMPPLGSAGTGIYWTLSGWHKVAPGDRLWVRENLKRSLDCDKYPVASYAVDSARVSSVPWQWKKNNLNSIHMPRWASRLTLEVTATKIERLQDIPLLDVRAEGCEVRQFALFGSDAAGRQAIGAAVFGDLWSKLHGEQSWSANPWVVAMSFNVHRANIDQLEKAA